MAYATPQEVGVYLDLGDEVGGQLDHGEVAFPYDLLELIETNLLEVGGVLRRHTANSVKVCVCVCVCVFVCMCTCVCNKHYI